MFQGLDDAYKTAANKEERNKIIQESQRQAEIWGQKFENVKVGESTEEDVLAFGFNPDRKICGNCRVVTGMDVYKIMYGENFQFNFSSTEDMREVEDRANNLKASIIEGEIIFGDRSRIYFSRKDKKTRGRIVNPTFIFEFDKVKKKNIVRVKGSFDRVFNELEREEAWGSGLAPIGGAIKTFSPY